MLKDNLYVIKFLLEDLKTTSQTHKSDEKIIGIDNLYKKKKNINFLYFEQIEDGISYHVIWNYYPKTRFEDTNLNEDEKKIRNDIWAFKDGSNNVSIFFSEIISDALLTLYERKELKKMILLPIPASNLNTNQKRYEKILYNVSKNIGIENGYNYIEILYSKKPKHQSCRKNCEINYKLKENYLQNKHIIILDDVITTGNTFGDICKILKNNIKSSYVEGLFLGKTVKIHQ